MNSRKLFLRREVLVELADTDLRDVGGGREPSDFSCGSCLMFVSCHLDDCLLRETFQVDCVHAETVRC